MDITTFRVQGTKNALEALAHEISRKLGRSDIARSIIHGLQGKFGTSATRWGLTAAGIGTATVANIKNLPGWANELFGSVGLDGAMANDIANEALDSVLRGTAEEMKDLTEEELQARVSGKVRDLIGEKGKYTGAFNQMTFDPKKVMVNVATVDDAGTHRYEYHIIFCPACQPVQQPRKKGANAQQQTPRFQNNIVKVSTIEVGANTRYPATTLLCCGPEIEKIVKAARRKLVNLFEAIAQLNANHAADVTAYRQGFANAPPEQTAILAQLANVKAWEEDSNVILMFIQECQLPNGFDTIGFIRRLRSKAAPSTSTTGGTAPQGSFVAGVMANIQPLRDMSARLTTDAHRVEDRTRAGNQDLRRRFGG